MADDLNEAARIASKVGKHDLAERLFHRSSIENNNTHSSANEVYERFLQGKATADEVRIAIHETGLLVGPTGNGCFGK